MFMYPRARLSGHRRHAAATTINRNKRSLFIHGDRSLLLAGQGKKQKKKEYRFVVWVVPGGLENDLLFASHQSRVNEAKFRRLHDGFLITLFGHSGQFDISGGH